LGFGYRRAELSFFSRKQDLIKRNDCPSDDIAGTKEIDIFVDFLESNRFDVVPDFALLGQ
jgi:hypothetical protein